MGGCFEKVVLEKIELFNNNIYIEELPILRYEYNNIQI